jgi:hypothetical protein
MAYLGSLFAATISATLAAVLLSQSAAQTANKHADPSVYEDDEVRITIPPGWHRATGKYPSLEPYLANGEVVVGNSVFQANGRLLLQKEGYTLALAYRTQHASGVEGGRFIEAFHIPWLNPDQAGVSCSSALTYVAQPASRTLLFQNILISTDVPDVRTKCGIPNNLGEWVGDGLKKRFIGERRWYAGYFTSFKGYFFDESSEPCGPKLYSLTSAAKIPSQLPTVEDSQREQIVQQAIDIVDSIQYKRCAPGPSSPLH